MPRISIPSSAAFSICIITSSVAALMTNKWQNIDMLRLSNCCMSWWPGCDFHSMDMLMLQGVFGSLILLLVLLLDHRDRICYLAYWALQMGLTCLKYVFIISSRWTSFSSATPVSVMYKGTPIAAIAFNACKCAQRIQATWCEWNIVPSNLRAETCVRVGSSLEIVCERQAL